MKISDLIPVIEGQIEHLIIGTLEMGVLAESDNFPYYDSVETFLHRFKNLNVDYIRPCGELEIVLKSDKEGKP